MSMKTLFYLSLICVVTLFSACGSNTQRPQRSFFPIPCMSKAGFYYVDENGEKMDALSGELAAIGWKPNLNYSLGSGFFKDGLLKVRDVYFLDRNGTLVLNAEEVFAKVFGEYAEYAKCSDFSEGIAFVQGGSLEDRTHATAINKKGEVLFELAGRPLTAFYEGVAYFMAADGNIGVFNSKGKILVEPREDIARAVTEYVKTPPLRGKASVKNEEGLIGAINFKGELVVDYISKDLPLEFDQNDCAVFYKDSRYGLVDGKGKILIEPIYTRLENDGNWYYFKTEDNKIGWCDKNGKEKITAVNRDIEFKYGRTKAGPYPFYGSDYSIAFSTFDLDGARVYKSHALTKEGLEDTLHLYLNGQIYGYLLVTPFVNGIAVGLDVKERTCALIGEKGIDDILHPELNDNYFACVWEPNDLEAIGDYIVHPWAYWKGAY